MKIAAVLLSFLTFSAFANDTIFSRVADGDKFSLESGRCAQVITVSRDSSKIKIQFNDFSIDFSNQDKSEVTRKEVPYLDGNVVVSRKEYTKVSSNKIIQGYENKESLKLSAILVGAAPGTFWKESERTILEQKGSRSLQITFERVRADDYETDREKIVCLYNKI